MNLTLSIFPDTMRVNIGDPKEMTISPEDPLRIATSSAFVKGIYYSKGLY